MTIYYRIDPEGGFTAAKAHTGETAYAFPGSDHAKIATIRPDRAAWDILNGEGFESVAIPHKIENRKAYDAMNMARIEAGRADGSTKESHRIHPDIPNAERWNDPRAKDDPLGLRETAIKIDRERSFEELGIPMPPSRVYGSPERKPSDPLGIRGWQDHERTRGNRPSGNDAEPPMRPVDMRLAEPARLSVDRTDNENER